MKAILNITRTELRTLFYSPIAWLVLVIYAFQCALAMTDVVATTAADSNAGMMLFDVTGRILTWGDGYFTSVQKSVYLYLPLLTMGLVSRELSSGSIKLVFSSPIAVRELVLGKYAAMLVYCLMMTFISAIALIPALLTIPHFDAGLAVGGLASTFLLILCYSAIGLFMSCLTSYQVVAAISTMVLLGGLSYIGEVGKGTDIIRDITGFLSIAGRAENLREGLLISTDVFYFLAIIIFFLTISAYYLTWKQKSVSALQKTVWLSLLVGVLTAVGLCCAVPRLMLYLDLTATQRKTLNEDTQRMLRTVRGPLKITAYVNLLDEDFWRYLRPEARKQDQDFWSMYTRFKPEIRFEYVYYYGKLDNLGFYLNYPKMTDRQIAEKKADAYGINFQNVLSADQLPDKDLLAEEGHRTVRVLESNGRKVPLRLFEAEMDSNPNEQDVADALCLLNEPPVRVSLLEGDGERGYRKENDKEYQMILTRRNYRGALINHGFRFSTTSVPDTSTDLLIIADPRTPIGPDKLSAIDRYIQSCRNLLVMGEPDKPGLINPVLAPLNIAERPGMIVERSKEFPPALVYQQLQTGVRLFNYRQLEEGIGRPVNSTGVGALNYKGHTDFSVFPILTSMPPRNWLRTSALLPDTGTVSFEPKLGDQRAPAISAYGLQRSLPNRPQQRIAVFADADWLTILELYRSGIHYNLQLVPGLFKWLGNGRFPKEITPRVSPDIVLKASKKDLFLFRIIFLGVLPGILLVWGSALLIRRRTR